MKKFWIGLAAGALIAGVAVSLLAPQTGKSTRKKLLRSLEDFGDNLSEAADYLKEQAERLATEAQQLVESSRGPLDDALETAQDYARTSGSEVGHVTSRLM